MPRKTKYSEFLEAEVARLKKAEALLSIALHLVNNASPAATERARVDDGRYIMSLYGATRACGGIVVVTFQYKRQTQHTYAEYLEDMMRQQSLPLAIASAVDKLRIARDRVFDSILDSSTKAA